MPDQLFDPSDEADRILRDLDGILERLDAERKASAARTLVSEPPADVEPEPVPEPPPVVEAPPVAAVPPNAEPAAVAAPEPQAAPVAVPSPFDPPAAPSAPLVQHSALPETGPETEPAPPPAAAAPAEPASADATLPTDIPPDRVRRVGFVFCEAAAPESRKFLAFVDEVSRKSSRNPIAVTPSFVMTYSEPDPRVWLEKAQETGSKAVVVVVPGRGEKKDMLVALSEAPCLAKVLALDETGRRAAVVDLVVDLLLGH